MKNFYSLSPILYYYNVHIDSFVNIHKNMYVIVVLYNIYIYIY